MKGHNYSLRNCVCRQRQELKKKNALSLALALHHTTDFKRCKRQHANKPHTRCSTCFPKACKMCRDACQLTFTLVPGFEQLANETTPTPQATQLTKTQQHGKRPITALVLANDFRSRFTPSALKQLIHKWDANDHFFPYHTLLPFSSKLPSCLKRKDDIRLESWSNDCRIQCTT